MTSCTPLSLRPRSTRWRRNADQPDLSSLAPSQIPRISRNPSALTAEATRKSAPHAVEANLKNSLDDPERAMQSLAHRRSAELSRRKVFVANHRAHHASSMNRGDKP